MPGQAEPSHDTQTSGDTDSSRGAGPGREAEGGAAARARKRRLAEIFGEVLPESTSDDRPGSDQARGDNWYRENRPPHHG